MQLLTCELNYWFPENIDGSCCKELFLKPLKKIKVIPLFREGFYKFKRAMAVNRGFVQLISLTVYCWLETFASWEEDLSMPAKCLSALPYIYLCEVQAVSLCPHAFFVFLSYASKPLWGLCVFFPPLANFVIASQKKNVSCSCCWVLPKATHGRSKCLPDIERRCQILLMLTAYQALTQ